VAFIGVSHTTMNVDIDFMGMYLILLKSGRQYDISAPMQADDVTGQQAIQPSMFKLYSVRLTRPWAIGCLGHLRITLKPMFIYHCLSNH
jgi:hypothetical protein